MQPRLTRLSRWGVWTLGVAEGVNAAEGEIVGDQEEEIGTGRLGGRCDGSGGCGLKKFATLH